KFIHTWLRFGEIMRGSLRTHPHMLRHACGYELAERGADTRLIQDYLGHRNIRHTVRYTASNAARFAGLWERNNLINEKLKREEV
ncbi:tyrosine-type recombinase/integrase, partial [Escherichia coli]|nr:tyrosine-type recombinase/integrase [Escherichia coli]